MLKNNYKLILIKEGDIDLRQFTISTRKIFYSVLFSLFTFFFLIFIFSDRILSFAGNSEVVKHQVNNKLLIEKIDEIEKRNEYLYKMLNQIQEQENKFRKMARLPSIDADVRKMGYGGANSKDESYDFEYLLPFGKKGGLKSIENKMDFIQRSMNLELISYDEILTRANENVNLVKSFPAIYPVEAHNQKVVSNFGYRKDPFTGKYQFHAGDDFSGRTGSDVFATADGRVKVSKVNGSFGNYIEVEHDNGYVTIYGHLSRRKVKAGEKVLRGQVIGSLGNTGRSTAPHLHYEVKYRKRNQDPSDFYLDNS